MIFISIEDFFNKTKDLPRLTKEEELECVHKMNDGDLQSRERLIENYLPLIASLTKRAKPQYQTLGLVMYYIEALEKAVDSFNFFSEGETFTHYLNRYLREAFVKYIVR